MGGRFESRVAVVTGASSGIGRATAIALSREGAQVILAARNGTRLGEVATQIERAGGSALAVACDVTDAGARQSLVERCVDHAGRLDVLVNAAGVIAFGDVLNTSLEAWREMFALNVDAVFHLMQLAAPHLVEAGGAIVNVSSVTGLRSFPGLLSYCSSKAAVDQLTRCAALELAPRGVRVNAVNPGVVVSELHRRGGLDDERYKAFLEHSTTTHPMGRVGQPEEVAEAILYLASGDAGWLTGVTLPIDGGRHLTCAR